MLAACASPAASPIATVSRLPTAAPSVTPTPPPAAFTGLPLVNVTPALVLEPPDFVPSPTPTVLALPLTSEKLIIEAPGPGSQTGSPIRVIGWGGPSYGDRIRIRLIREDGEVLAQLHTWILAPTGRAGRFVVDVPFRFSSVAEAALIEASYDNPLTGRLDHLTTRRVVLLTTGRPLIHPYLVAAEKLTILSPYEGRIIEGGSIQIRGAAWLDEDLPLLVELIDQPGNVLASAEVTVAAPALGQLGTFDVTLPYTITDSQYAWLAVTERGTTPPMVMHYTSVRVYLKP